MKTIRAFIFGSLFIAAAAHAQLVVYDPTVHTQQILDQAQNIAKYVEMVNNQIEQINKLTSQLQELEKYNEAFGNPAQLLNIRGVNGLVRDLRKTELGQSIEQIRNVARGIDALTYNANGLYHSIGATFKTPSGAEIKREEAIYRDNAAVQRTAQNYTNVFDDVRERRRALKEEIAATTEKLQGTATASEVQKLTGVLVGLNAALAATDKEVDQALSLTIVQEAENRNDTEKQTKARGEEQKAEFSESLQKYRQTFQPLTAPPIFPENRR
jgi:acid phosphatase family membrane protein YuiD